MCLGLCVCIVLINLISNQPLTLSSPTLAGKSTDVKLLEQEFVDTQNTTKTAPCFVFSVTDVSCLELPKNQARVTKPFLKVTEAK